MIKIFRKGGEPVATLQITEDGVGNLLDCLPPQLGLVETAGVEPGALVRLWIVWEGKV